MYKLYLLSMSIWVALLWVSELSNSPLWASTARTFAINLGIIIRVCVLVHLCRGLLRSCSGISGQVQGSFHVGLLQPGDFLPHLAGLQFQCVRSLRWNILVKVVTEISFTCLTYSNPDAPCNSWALISARSVSNESKSAVVWPSDSLKRSILPWMAENKIFKLIHKEQTTKSI